MKGKGNLLLVIAIVLVVFFGNQAFAGQVITVDDDGPADYSAIQDAIDAAIDGDIVVVADGIYTGNGNRDIDFGGRAITVKSENGSENCVIDCNGTENEPHRGFYFHNDEDANSIVDGFTITNGYASAISPWPIPLPDSAMIPNEPLGGAIYCDNAGPTINNCNIIGNIAAAPHSENNFSLGAGGYGYGGGIYCQGSKGPTVTNCIIADNKAIVPLEFISATGNPLDMAIVGEGYFVLNDGTRDVFTRSGHFAIDAKSNMVDPTTGYIVQRIGSAGEENGFQVPGDSNIRIPYDIALPPKATSLIRVQDNLNATGTSLEVTQTNIMQSNIAFTYGSGSAAQTTTLISGLDQYTGALTTGMITFSGYEPDGTALNGTTGLLVDVTTTMGHLLDHLNNNVLDPAKQTASLNNGKIVITDTASGYSKTDFAMAYSGDGTMTMPAYFEITTVGGEEVRKVDITIYDSIGGTHVFSAAFVRTNTYNMWDLILTSISGNIDTLTFDNRRINGIEFSNIGGSFSGLNDAIGDTAQFTIAFPHDISNPQTINIDMGIPGQFNGLTQFAKASSAIAKEQDGHQPGTLCVVSVNSDGVIIGTFTNGIERNIATVQLAMFNDPNALGPVGHGYFIPTVDSGSPIPTAPGDGRAGAILGGHLENLNNNRYALQGPNVYTARNLDAAIEGDGYFVLNDGLQNLFTRIGSFDSDVNSMLIDPATGYRVQRIGSVGETDGFQIPGDSNIYISYDMLVPAEPTSEIIVTGNLSANDSYGEKNITTWIYDSQGGRHILSAAFVRTEIHTWDLVLTSVTGEIDPLIDRRIEGITFNGSNGSYAGLNSGDPTFEVKFPFDPGATQTISFFFGTVGQFDGLTQFAQYYTAVVRQQNGYQAGQLSSVAIGRDGSITGRFTNGTQSNLATIQLAMFQNPEYLQPLDNGYFAATTASGQPVAELPGDNGAGTIISQHLEDPNADRYFYRWYIRRTDRQLDMAIMGERYYFVLNDGNQDIFTRIGSFDIDEDGILAEPVRGFKVQRIGSVGEENGYQTAGNSNIYISYDMLMPANPTSNIKVRGNLSAYMDEEKNIVATIYDSQGDYHILYAVFVRTEIDTWDLVITSVTGEIAPLGERRIVGITFNPLNGSYAGLNSGDPTFEVKFPFDPGATQTISFFFGIPGQFNGLTQFSNTSTAEVGEVDGYAVGTLLSVSVNNEGMLVGSFSNGMKSNIAQIKIATCQAPWALQTIDHGYFVPTTTSGDAVATQALSGAAGPIRGETLYYPKVNDPRRGNSFGGGMYCKAPAIIKNCLITGNSSGNGGGIYCQTDALFENCTISGNIAANTGGGIYCSIIAGPKEPYKLPLPLPDPEDTVIRNSILSDNIAEQGRQISLNSIGIWLTPTGIGEPESQFEPDFPGLRVAYNNIQDGEQGLHIEYDDYLVWDQTNIDEYPCFVDAANGDYHLLANSLCIDAGDPDYIPEVNETDLDGNSRVINGRVDMGAYEYDPPILADVAIEPKTLNLSGRGKWISCRIWLPEDYDVADVNTNSILLEGQIAAAQVWVNEEEQVVMTKFSRADVQDILEAGVVELIISGELVDGSKFEGTDTIRVK